VHYSSELHLSILQVQLAIMVDVHRQRCPFGPMMYIVSLVKYKISRAHTSLPPLQMGSWLETGSSIFAQINELTHKGDTTHRVVPRR